MPITTRPGAILLIVLAAGLLAACAAKLSPDQASATAAVFDLARRHEFAAIEARLPPAQRNAVLDARLQAQAALIPDRSPGAVKLVSFNSAKDGDGERVAVVREYFYPDRLLIVSTALYARSGQPTQVIAFNIQALPPAALAVGQFSLKHKSTMQYFLLGLAVGIPLLLVAALAILARDRKARWKWLWTIFILIGLMRLSVNWTTGAILFEPFTLLPLGAAVARGALDVSPWFVSISLPLGALVYLGRLWFAAPPDEAE